MKQTLFFAQKAFILKDSKLLVVQKSKFDPNQPLKWEVPGGRINFGESVNTHLLREVMEETGLEIRQNDIFHLWDWVIDRIQENGDLVQMHIIAIASICDYVTGEISLSENVEDDYIEQVIWVEIKDLNDLDWIENMKPVIEKFQKFILNLDNAKMAKV